jgi:molybdate transport system substrate-binding protein
MRRRLRLSLLFACGLFAAAPEVLAQAPAPTVFAAASLKSALDEAAGAFAGPAPRLSYGGSLALVRQIAQGAPADLLCTADSETMDAAQTQGLIAPASRVDLFGNALVLVAPARAPFEALALEADALARALGQGRLATGHVDSVPAGRYGREALRALGLWDVAQPRLAMSENVRAALVFVAREEAPLGLVYATDAFAEPRVKIVARIPASAHAPIVYPCAVTAQARAGAGAQAFLDFLKSEAAWPAFARQGFTRPR